MDDEALLDDVLDAIERIINQHRVAFDQRKIVWLPVRGYGRELERCRRGSRRWILGTWQMQINDRYFWYEQFTGRRRNTNPDVNGKPTWRYESIADRVTDDAAAVFDQHGTLFEDEFRDEIIQSLLWETTAKSSFSK
jgi:hypothetical protein